MISLIHLRISNNVLTESDFPDYQVSIRNDVVAGIRTIKPGCYDLYGVYAGMGVEELLTWLRYDSTGHHPEEYHEVRALGQEWRSVSNMEELKQVLKKGEIAPVV